jgi:hypothetical protein
MARVYDSRVSLICSCHFLAGAWALPEGDTVTRDRARKRAIRARMAASGEPYSVAARKLDATAPVSDAAAVRAIIGCAASTLAVPSARIEFRTDWEFTPRPGLPERRSPGLVGRLARRAAGAAWARIAPGVDAASLRDAFAHQVAVGYLEPAADRYLMDSGAYAEMRVNGKRYGGPPGAPLQGRRPQHAPGKQPDEPTGLLRLLQDVTDARYTGEETLRGTVCRSAAARAGSAELTVWIDAEHVRRIQIEDRASDEFSSTGKRLTLELWDFGVPVDSLDWSRLPSFVTPG